MTKSELINALRDSVNACPEGSAFFSKVDIGLVLVTLEMITIESLASEGEAILPGIGKLKVKETREREGRNPATGEAITIPAGKRVVFKATKSVKDSVLEG